MITRIGNLLVMTAAFSALSVGCQQQAADNALKPLSAEEAAKYRQVTVHVKGMT